ncbi:hypothetical protein D3C76_1828090 [compost metagenome]
MILQGSKEALEHNLKFYRTILVNSTKLRPEAVKELENKISINEKLLGELQASAARNISHRILE